MHGAMDHQTSARTSRRCCPCCTKQGVTSRTLGVGSELLRCCSTFAQGQDRIITSKLHLRHARDAQIPLHRVSTHRLGACVQTSAYIIQTPTSECNLQQQCKAPGVLPRRRLSHSQRAPRRARDPQLPTKYPGIRKSMIPFLPLHHPNSNDQNPSKWAKFTVPSPVPVRANPRDNSAKLLR